MEGCASSSKQQEAPLEPTNNKEDICLEKMKKKVKRATLEWDNLVLQEQLKSLMYIERSLRDYPQKDKFIDELNFKNCNHNVLPLSPDFRIMVHANQKHH